MFVISPVGPVQRRNECKIRTHNNSRRQRDQPTREIVAGLWRKERVPRTDKGLTKVGLTDQVGEKIKNANINLVVYDDVVANPTVEVVDNGAKLLRELMKTGTTVVVTLGGGSSMDAGKAIAMLSQQDTGSILDYTIVPALAKGKDTIDFGTRKRSIK